MKKILSTFLLSAMLVLVLGACGSEGDNLSEARETRKELRQEETIEKLERQVEALMLEARWLHLCARDAHEHPNVRFGSSQEWEYHYHSYDGDCTIEKRYYPHSPFRSNEAFDRWEGSDYVVTGMTGD